MINSIGGINDKVLAKLLREAQKAKLGAGRFMRCATEDERLLVSNTYFIAAITPAHEESYIVANMRGYEDAEIVKTVFTNDFVKPIKERMSEEPLQLAHVTEWLFETSIDGKPTPCRLLFDGVKAALVQERFLRIFDERVVGFTLLDGAHKRCVVVTYQGDVVGCILPLDIRRESIDFAPFKALEEEILQGVS